MLPWSMAEALRLVVYDATQRQRPPKALGLSWQYGTLLYRALGRVEGVPEQGDGWDHLGIDRVGQDAVRLGRPFDQDGIRLQVVQRAGQRAGRAGTVVADAQHVCGHEVSTSRDAR